MSVDKETVRRIARLARIAVKDGELDTLSGELSKILDWVDLLDEVHTDNVEPMTSVVDQTLKEREDDVTDGGYRDKILKNAPDTDHGFFVVPKVVE